MRFTRRELVGAGVLAALLPAGARADSQTVSDPDLARALLAAERLAVFVYAEVTRHPVLSPRAQRLTRQLLDHERAHARALASALAPARNLPPPLHSRAEAERLLAASRIAGSLSHVTNEHEALSLLIGLEVALERSYYTALRQLQDPQLIGLASGILASEAQHASTLVWLAHPREIVLAVPEAFVEGNPGDVPAG